MASSTIPEYFFKRHFYSRKQLKKILVCQLHRYTVDYFIQEPGKNKTTEKTVKPSSISPSTSEHPQNPGELGFWFYLL